MKTVEPLDDQKKCKMQIMTIQILAHKTLYLELDLTGKFAHGIPQKNLAEFQVIVVEWKNYSSYELFGAGMLAPE